MKKKNVFLPLAMAFSATALSSAALAGPLEELMDDTIGEKPTIQNHMDQSEIEMGHIRLKEVINHGQLVFDARFNSLDGRGRPATTGGGAPRDPHGQPEFLRTSGPDANACAGCHNQPSSGGAGEFVANVFVLAQTLDPVTESISPEFSNERNTLGMFGSGAIEMLAREMSEELIAIRETAKAEAAETGTSVTKPLVAKGVSFGAITVTPEGLVDPTQIEGVDWDLVVKPFHQKGAVVSLRQFTNNAMNHHHGIQTTERFGENTDPDQDGVMNELSVGDVTAATIYQASLTAPRQKMPMNPVRRNAARQGEQLFNEVGCNSCHVPSLQLNTRMFSEPNPYNPAGNLQVSDVSEVFTFDMTRFTKPHSLLKRNRHGAEVRAFTDLKRHNLCDDDYNHFCNEQLTQGSLVGFASPEDFTVPAQPRPTEVFLTRKLWDVADSDPYGHRGDLTTITEAVYQHGGEAREVRDEFFGLPQEDQDKIVEFLKTLGVF
jgi:cytochrome c peroxidase